MDPVVEHARLVADIERWNREYYELFTPTVPDAEWDSAMVQLRAKLSLAQGN